ncbi:hypothetical protein [Streptomyces sp. NPDC054834]
MDLPPEVAAVWKERLATKTVRRRQPDGTSREVREPRHNAVGIKSATVATALKELRRAGGYRRGIAAQLAREHGGNERSWRRDRGPRPVRARLGPGRHGSSPAGGKAFVLTSVRAAAPGWRPVLLARRLVGR